MARSEQAEVRVLMAGFGGQGIMRMGQILAAAAMAEGLEVSWLPSYGPEMRGGTANCAVILSPRPIRSPLIDQDATSALIMNGPSYDNFADRVQAGGLLVLNSSLVDPPVLWPDVKSLRIPGTEAAQALGNLRVANMVMLGAWLAATETIHKDAVVAALQESFGTERQDLVDLNTRALERGAALQHAHA